MISYIQNDKIKSVRDKIDIEKLKEIKELYNKLPVDNKQLQMLLDSSLYNPKYANSDVYRTVLGLPTQQTEIESKKIVGVDKQANNNPITKSVTTEINKLTGYSHNRNTT